MSDLLEPFGKSSIIISVDSGKNIYPYFRHGGEWETLESNIKNFKKHNNFTSVDTSITTSVFQLMDIYDVFDSFYEGVEFKSGGVYLERMHRGDVSGTHRVVAFGELGKFGVADGQKTSQDWEQFRTNRNKFIERRKSQTPRF